MITISFKKLKEMPINNNGKINRNVLPEPDKDTQNIEEYTAPRNHVEEKFAEVWGEVLGVNKVGINHNFFDLGGHSLKAAVIVAKLQKDFEVGMNDIFKYPTIEQLSRHISFKKNNFKIRFEKIKEIVKEKQKDIMDNSEIEERINLYNKKNIKYNSIDYIEQNHYENILLTGSTGYLGIYLLKNLLEKKESEVYVLVRGNTIEAAEERLIKKMEYHFNSDIYKKYKSRIHVLNGDLTKVKFNLPKDVYNKLTKIIDCIIHPAASVKHYGLYEEFYEINVRATERLLEFAQIGKIKDFQHVSTLSVAMGDIENKKKVLFTEEDCDMNQNSNNVYAKTKFEAEKLVLNARKKGINTNIFRVGNIVFDSSTGKFQENIESNAFYTLIKSYVKLGMIPIAKEKDTDFSFVDYVSEAIITLFDKKEIINETFHIQNANYVRLSDVLCIEKYNLDIKAIEFDKFIDYLHDNFEIDSNTIYIQNVMLHYGWLDENLSSIEETEYILCFDKTNLILSKLGFKWPELTEEHIIKMLNHCRGVNFL